jgi:hypothetical protein
MHQHAQRARWHWFGGALAVAAAVGIVLAPIATGEHGASPSPIPQACQLQTPQPEAPLKLNVVTAKHMAKTVAMEKEVFNCFDAQSRLAQIKDVETFIEFASRAGGSKGSTERGRAGKSPAMPNVSKRIDAITCVKDLTTGRVSCKSDTVPLGTTDTPLAKCSTTSGTYPFAEIQQPTHPVEMQTVVLGKLVMTVKVEKEVFQCSGRIADLYLFTRIVESAGSHSFDPVATQFDGVICFKDEATAKIAACQLFTPQKAA